MRSPYLWAVHDEASQRGYSFDTSKNARKKQPRLLTVSQGQLDFELGNLKAKLRKRDPKRYRELCCLQEITAHSLFTVVAGEIEPWERPCKGRTLGTVNFQRRHFFRTALVKKCRWKYPWAAAGFLVF